MKRLTKRYSNGNITLDAAQFGIDQAVLDTEINNSEPIAAAVKRLADYENAEEKGLLAYMPCKVGDTVYRLSAGMIIPADVLKMENIDICGWCMIVSDGIYILFSDFGKTVFLTLEAAQQALKARKNKTAL